MALLDFLRRDPRKKPCARCGQPSFHGYSKAAESKISQITPLCTSCLNSQLQKDYGEFLGRAIVVRPAAGLPCYVFRNREFFRSLSSSPSGLLDELDDLLHEIVNCRDCGQTAHCLWIESEGLTRETQDELLANGLRKTLTAWGNPQRTPLCGACTVRRMSENLRSNGASYIEVCSPHATDEGIVLPMGY